MASRDPDRPNVLLVLTDDQGYWALGCAGNEELQTPRLDRMAAEAVRLESYFCVTPVCSAARAALLTGRIASANGVHDWLRGTTEGPPLLEGQSGFTDILARNDYVCGHCGKWHLGAEPIPQKSYSWWRPRYGGGYMTPRFCDNSGRAFSPGGYLTHRITELALHFLGARLDSEAPFFLSVHHVAPHSPWDRQFHPDDYYMPYYENCPFESVPDEPRNPNDAGITDFFDSPESRRAKLSGYYGSITAVDGGVGRLLDWLEAHDLRENTLVFFTSDNGMNMGHHGICGKGNGTLPVNLFDTSCRVPALLSRPGHLPRGVVAEGLYSHCDWRPTLLDYLGLDDPEADDLPGRSYAGLLRGERDEGADAVVVYDEYGPARMIRTRGWKYVHRYGEDQRNELYDLGADPGERENLVGRAEHAGRIEKLRERMQQWFDCYADPELDGSKLPVSGCGQLKPANEPAAFAQAWPEDWLRGK